MLELFTFENIYFALSFIVPGRIIVFFRSKFLIGRRSQSHYEALLSYITISVVYLAIALSVMKIISEQFRVSMPEIYYLPILVILVPTILGIIIGVSTKNGWGRRIVNRIGFHPVHVMPTAWDWKFSAYKEELVLVTLKDETKIAGYISGGSFMSSDPEERDIYIEKLYELEDNDDWTNCDPKSILIMSGEIQTIEFIPMQHG